MKNFNIEKLERMVKNYFDSCSSMNIKEEETEKLINNLYDWFILKKEPKTQDI